MKEPRPTALVESVRLSERLGANVVIANEGFQWTGSYKFRGASNVARSVSNPRIITASSGNFGQALAFACKLAGKACIVVMPANAARVKIDAVRSYGATVDLVDTKVTRREDRVAALKAANPEAYVASAFDDTLVIQGNASLGRELALINATSGHRGGADALEIVEIVAELEKQNVRILDKELAAKLHKLADPPGLKLNTGASLGRASRRPFDAILAPIGGGGLCAGIVTGLRAAGDQTPVWAVEPAMANDFVQSLAAKRIVAHDQEPQTVADGARTRAVGTHNWEILKDSLAGAIEVSEDEIREAVRLCFSLANVKAEPTGAVAVAALLAQPDRFRGQRVCCVVTGGNVDPAVYLSIIGGG
jgi:threonine dehydratase